MDSWVLVTGASGGIGAAVAERLAADGHHLFLHYHTNEALALDVAKRCRALGSDALTVRADLSSPSGPDKLMAQLFGKITGYVHASGVSRYGLFTELTKEALESDIQLHLKSPLFISQQLLPNMIRQQSGHLLFISSVWGERGAACEVTYATVKGGLNSFVKSLAKEVGPSGIRVNGIAPGMIDTTMLKRFSSEEMNYLIDEVPAGRIGRPAEVAEAVAFLFSSRSTYITGEILTIDGGWKC